MEPKDGETTVNPTFVSEKRALEHVKRLLEINLSATSGQETGFWTRGSQFSHHNGCNTCYLHNTGTCNNFKQTPSYLMLRLFGKHVQRDTQDVELSLYIWDNRLACRDSFPLPDDQQELHLTTLKRMPKTNILVKLQLDENQHAHWVHRRLNGEQCYADKQVIDLSDIWLCSTDSLPEKVDWRLHNSSDTTPSCFRCFIDVGCTDAEDVTGAEFLSKKRLEATLQTPVPDPERTSSSQTSLTSQPVQQPQTEEPPESFEFKTPVQIENPSEVIRTNELQLPMKEHQEAASSSSDPGFHPLNPNDIKVEHVLQGTDMWTRFKDVVMGRKEREIYRMQQRIRGSLLIINNKAFSRAKSDAGGLKPRNGTEMDVKALQNLFYELRFNVEIKNDHSAEEMRKVIEEHLMRDHVDYDCFVCAILSHGREGAIAGDDGNYLEIKDIKKIVYQTKNKSLTDKPKLFFVQACQGGLPDIGNELDDPSGAAGDSALENHFEDGNAVQNISGDVGDVDSPTDDGASTPSKTSDKAVPGCGFGLQQDENSGCPEVQQASSVPSCLAYTLEPDGPKLKVPRSADLFFGFPAGPGFLSYRNDEHGTVFIQNIVRVFSENAYKDDLLTLMTKVNGQASTVETRDEGHMQQPGFESFLRKTLYFFPGLYHPRPKS